MPRIRAGAQQSLRIGMPGLRKNSRRWPLFDHTPGIQDGDPFADFGDDAEIV